MMRTLALSLSIAVGSTLGCTQNDQSLAIAYFAQITTTGMSCSATSQGGNSVISGTFDVAVYANQPAAGFDFAPVVQNNLVVTGTITTIERNNVNVSGYDVEIHLSGGGTVGSPVRLNGPAGLVAPAGGRTVGIVRVVSEQAAQSLLGKASEIVVILHTRAVGQHAGSELTSDWVDFPLRICRGCLTLTEMGSVPDCPMNGYTANQILLGNSCNFAQDAVVTCCRDAIAGVLCGPRVPMLTGTSMDLSVPVDMAVPIDMYVPPDMLSSG